MSARHRRYVVSWLRCREKGEFVVELPFCEINLFALQDPRYFGATFSTVLIRNYCGSLAQMVILRGSWIAFNVSFSPSSNDGSVAISELSLRK